VNPPRDFRNRRRDRADRKKPLSLAAQLPIKTRFVARIAE